MECLNLGEESAPYFSLGFKQECQPDVECVYS